MHNLKQDIEVLAFGNKDFFNTINELKPYLKFVLNLSSDGLNDNIPQKFILLIHEDFLTNIENKNIIKNINNTKILASHSKTSASKLFDYNIELPIMISEINKIIIAINTKKKFNKNSSIKIKEYTLDKNEKKLKKGDSSLILTEKEINLLELFQDAKKPLSKHDIQKTVWGYSETADTHTVETHIYRLRKKIKEEFLDEEFIQNDKKGYYI